MKNGSLGSVQMDTRARGGVGGGGGGEFPCFAHLICTAQHGIGFWDLQF